jgi:Reverse transcriptase (RNA-dependent DNA polymerase)
VSIVYADDILLMTRTRRHLQDFILCVQAELGVINIHLNPKKCAFMRIGPNYDKPCASNVSADGTEFATVAEQRYLGVTIVSGRVFRVSMDRSRRAFSRAANSILHEQTSGFCI